MLSGAMVRRERRADPALPLAEKTRSQIERRSLLSLFLAPDSQAENLPDFGLDFGARRKLAL
jgi:hypothetical protein